MTASLPYRAAQPEPNGLSTCVSITARVGAALIPYRDPVGEARNFNAEAQRRTAIHNRKRPGERCALRALQRYTANP